LFLPRKYNQIMPAPGGVNANLFALLDDDENDENDTPVQKAPAAKPQKAPKEDKPKEGKGERKKDDRRPRNKGGSNQEHSNVPYDGNDKPDKPSEGEGRGKGRGRRYEGDDRRKGKGKGEGRGRNFDRQSGTGRGKGEAREGRGKFNWGEKGDQGTEATEGAPPKTEGEAAPEPEPEPEEEENTMTLDEYMASKKSGFPAKKQPRKLESTEAPAGVRVDRNADGAGKTDEMYGMIFKAYDGKIDDRDAKEAREGWVNTDEVFNVKFADPNQGGGDSRGKGDRGDRRKGGKGAKGKDRGGRGGGNQQRRPQQQQGKIELEDTNAFPTLA
jgi:plasminogen activator inhibitor 1 RNA-binding protein